MRKMGIIVVAVLAAAAFALPALAEGLRIAVVDVNKVLNESEEGKAAKKKMESRFDELKKEIDARQEELKKLKDEIDKQKVIATKEKLKDKEDAFQAKAGELRKLTQESEREMQGRQGELTREVLKRIEGQIDALIKAEKYDLVLERSAGVIHVADSMDLTERVLAMMNKDRKGAGPEKAPAEKKGPGTKKEGAGGK
jgi:outer membrane protein